MIRSLIFAISLLVAALPAVAQAPLRIDLNIPALKLVVYEGDRVVKTYPIAVGMPGFICPRGSSRSPTPNGTPGGPPRPIANGRRTKKKTPPGPTNPMGRVRLFFLPLYFIHGTPAGESIGGTPASHGCIRMLNEDVIALARLLHERAAPQISAAELARLSARWGNPRRVDFRQKIEVVLRYDPVVVENSEILAYPDIYGRKAIHSESVYQALMAAGYDVSRVDHVDVRRFVDRAQGLKAPLVLKLDDVFKGKLAIAG